MTVSELVDAIGVLPPGQSGSPLGLWKTGYNSKYQIPWFVSRPWRAPAAYRISTLLKLISRHMDVPFDQRVQDTIQAEMMRCGIKEKRESEYSKNNGAVRTYKKLLEEHGLIHWSKTEKKICFTPKGIEIMGQNDILCIPPMFFEQLLRHQFPNPCSLRGGSVIVHPEVKVRMYRFLMSVMAILLKRGIASISGEQTAICACLGSGWQFLELCVDVCTRCSCGNRGIDMLRSLGVDIGDKEWGGVLAVANTTECRLLSTGVCRRVPAGRIRRLALSDSFEDSMDDVLRTYIPNWFEVEKLTVEDAKDEGKIREFQFRHGRGFLLNKSNLKAKEPKAITMPQNADGLREIILHEFVKRVLPNVDVPPWHPVAARTQLDLEKIFPPNLVKQVVQELLSCNAIENTVQEELKSYSKGNSSLARKAEERAASLMRHGGFVAQHFGSIKSNDGKGWDYADVFAFLRDSRKYVLIDSKIGRKFCLSEKDKVVVGGYIKRAQECAEIVRISTPLASGYFVFVCSKIDYSPRFTRRMAEVSSKHGIPVSAISWRDFWIMCDAMSVLEPRHAESKLSEYLGKSGFLSIGNMDGLYDLLNDRQVRMVERDIPLFLMLYGTGDR